VLIQRDAGSCVEDAAEVGSGEIRRDDLLISVSQHSIHFTISSCLHCGLDLVIGCLVMTRQTVAVLNVTELSKSNFRTQLQMNDNSKLG